MSRGPRDDLWRWLETKQETMRAVVPKDLKAREAMARECARLHAKANASDPFAWGRAHNAVMRGLLDLSDFKSGAISC